MRRREDHTLGCTCTDNRHLCPSVGMYMHATAICLCACHICRCQPQTLCLHACPVCLTCSWTSVAPMSPMHKQGAHTCMQAHTPPPASPPVTPPHMPSATCCVLTHTNPHVTRASARAHMSAQYVSHVPWLTATTCDACTCATAHWAPIDITLLRVPLPYTTDMQHP